MTTTTPDPLLDRQGIAAVLGVAPETVSQYQHRHRRDGGAAPAFPDPDRVYSNGKLRLYRESRIRAWLDARDNQRAYDPNPPLDDGDDADDVLIDMEGVAIELGVQRSYVPRIRYRHRRGGMYPDTPFPEPEVVHGQVPLFSRKAVRDFQRSRPGRTGRPMGRRAPL